MVIHRPICASPRFFVDRSRDRKYNPRPLFRQIQRSPYRALLGKFRHEENLSAQPPQACPDPRLPRPDGHPQRPKGAGQPPRQGPGTPDTLSVQRLQEADDQRLPRQRRLRRPPEFKAVFAEASRSVDACFTVLARPNRLGRPRLGLAVAKKCARRAVDRNRLKRVVRESFRAAQGALPNVDVVVLCRSAAVGSSNARLFTSLSGHWERIRDQLCAGC